MKMTAPVFHGVGTPLTMLELELDSPGPGEALVRIAAAGVCHSCLLAVDGQHPHIPTPIVLGDEGSGTVVEVGAGVTNVREGDRVIVSWAPGCAACGPCRSGAPALCQSPAPFGRMRDGQSRIHADGREVFHYGPATYAPYMVIPAGGLVPVVDDMPLDLAALIGCAVATGVNAVWKTAGVRPGNSVAVVGCGGVGLNAIQAAALAGAYPVIGVDVNEAKFELARRFGATHTVDARLTAAADAAHPGLPEAGIAVQELSRGGVDFAFLTAGSPQGFDTAMATLGPRGTCVLIAGFPLDARVSLDPLRILDGERRVIGSKYGSSNPPVDFPKLVDRYLAGQLELDALVSGRFRPDQANEAFDVLRTGESARNLIVFDESALS